MKLVDQIIQLLQDDPGNWWQGDHKLVHSSGLKLWVHNGFSSCEPCDPNRMLSLIDRWKLWRAVKKWNQLPIDVGGRNEQ